MSTFAEKEAAAKARAVERIAKILQRPDQLEKVEEYAKREARKKASKEALLKTALQHQLDGVKQGLEIFKETRQDVQELAKNMAEVRSSLKDIVKLGKTLDEVREESQRHAQYAMAMENMSNIFSINKNLEKSFALINEGNLLHAHIRLSELEASRDELLYELFRVGNKSEQTMLLDYFSDVERLSETLERQLTLNLKRAINTARKEPTILVTTLRIIEREERLDTLAFQRHEASGFWPPGRPKRWKTKAYVILEEAVNEQLEACQLETRAENKLWLVRYLEVMRQLILENLLVVKSLAVPCFPPSHNILQRYVQMYHRSLSKQLQECVMQGMEGNEFVSLLSWVLNTYEGPDLLANAQLALDSATIPRDLLSKEMLAQLMREYLVNIGSNYRSWRTKTLAKEVEEWWSSAAPPADNNGHLHTEAPIIIFQMVDENLQVAKTVHVDLVQEVLLLSLDMIREYGQNYAEQVREFKAKYFQDRSQVKNFTQFTIAIVNNCLLCIELAKQTKDKYWKSAVDSNKAATRFEALLQTFEALRNRASGYLLEEAFLDLEPYFQKLRGNWLRGTVEVETICVTLKDYFQDYNYLKPRNLEIVMSQGKDLVATKYLQVLMARKTSLKTQEERREGAEKILKERKLMEALFEQKPGTGTSSSGGLDSNPFTAFDSIAEVIKVEDLDILSLELHSFVKKYPDLSREQLSAILALRSDLGRGDIKQRVAEVIPEEASGVAATSARAGVGSVSSVGVGVNSIFSKVQVPPSLF